MKKLFVAVFVLMLSSGLMLDAQKISIQKGSLGVIKGQKMLATFDYSGMAVGKFDKEDDYIAKKMEDYNKDEAGKGDKWATSWKGDRERRYEPKFEELFNKYGEKPGVSAFRSATDAKYEVNIHTIFTEPGFNVGVMRKPAYIDAIVTFKDRASGEEVAVVKVDNVPGMDAMGYDFDTGVRIEESYAKLGKSLAGFIAKQK
ncbi:MAG: hypothetical protein MUE74_13900 [Bacteroidales bacterium]|jgi:hypothetical protein|nr:hypothetical protein [Bacteroidales bacterium]